MKIFNRIPERIQVLLLILGIMGLLYVPVRAIINIAGNPVYPGRGSYFSSGAGYDTSNIGVMFGIIVNDTAIGADTTSMKTEFAKYFLTISTVQQVTAVKGFSDTLRLGTGGVDGILSIFSEQGATDYKVVIKPHTTMTQDVIYVLPPNDGDASQVLTTDGSGNLTWGTPGGTGDMLKSTYDVAENGVVDDVDTAGTQIHAALVLRATKAMLTDTTWMVKDAIHDSTWQFGPLSPLRSFAIREGVSDSVGILYPIATDVSNWCVKHYNTSLTVDDQMDTIVYSWVLPDEVPDVDSVTFNMRSSDADTSVSGLRIRCFKQTAELGAQTALTAALIGFSTATDAWEHKTIVGASIGAVTGGDEFSIRMCVQLDVTGILYYDEPKVYCPHK
jgi:hypothetical protein